MNEAIYMIEARARQLWALREQDFPKFTRQRWEDGSRAAKHLIAQTAQAQLITEGLIVITDTGIYPGPNAVADCGEILRTPYQMAAE